MATTCHLCATPTPEGLRFCEACEREVIDRNIHRMKAHLRREFTEADRVEAMVRMEERRIHIASN